MSASDEENRQLFLKPESGKPVKFFLHNSLSLVRQTRLERDILPNGGVLCEEEEGADIILVDEQLFHLLRKRYDHSKVVYVELPDFVRRCIKRKSYIHDMPQKKSLGGRPPGIIINAYTHEDDLNLARYIAARLPYREQGGRQGDAIYKELCDTIHEDEYPWAARHPWQSWRNRYRRNSERINSLVDEILAVYPPHPQGKGEYQHDRRLAGQNRRGAPRHRHIGTRKEDDDELESSDAEVGTPVARRTPDQTVEQRDLGENSTSHGDRRGDSSVTDSSPEQARKVQPGDQNAQGAGLGGEVHEELLNGGNLERFDDDYGGMYDDYEPPALVNTQVARGDGQEPDTAEKFDALPDSSRIPVERRMAARNRARSAVAKPGATGRTAFTTSPPKSTQATLVATQMSTQLKGPQPSMAPREAAPAVRPAQASEVADRVHANLKRPNDEDEVIVVPVSRPSSAAVQNAPQKKRRVNVDRMSRGDTVTVDAPYRNTRARSRSVEPMPPPAIRPKARAKVTMKTVEEVPEEGDNDVGGRATFDEQQSLDVVEDAIRIVETQEGGEVVQITDSEDDNSSGGEEEEEEDAVLLERGKDIRKSIVAESTPHQSRSSGPSFTGATYGTTDEHTAVEARSKTTAHRRVESSESDFPTPGTRAKDARYRQDEIEKATPFAPTPGTRAELVRATQRASGRPVAKAMARKVAKS